MCDVVDPDKDGPLVGLVLTREELATLQACVGTAPFARARDKLTSWYSRNVSASEIEVRVDSLYRTLNTHTGYDP